MRICNIFIKTAIAYLHNVNSVAVMKIIVNLVTQISLPEVMFSSIMVLLLSYQLLPD